jgi:cytidylate kinase
MFIVNTILSSNKKKSKNKAVDSSVYAQNSASWHKNVESFLFNEEGYSEVLESLQKRDYSDTHREFSRMVVTHDSIVVDNTNMTIAQTIDHCYNLAVEKLKELGKI